MSPKKAYGAAGFKASGKPGRLMEKEEIQARIKEIERRIGWSETRDVKLIIEDLKEAFHKAVALNTGAGMVAARGLAAEAAKLKQLLPREPEPHEGRARRMQSLTEAEWIKLYGQPAP